MLKRLLLAGLVFFICGPGPWNSVLADVDSGPDAAEFEKALMAAKEDLSLPFGFAVHCRDENGIRSARLYPSGAGVWGGKLQIIVGKDRRRALLNDFLSSGFSSFAPRYGGKSEDGRSSGPLRISCRIKATAGGTNKISVQLADGEQSRALTGLAASLLDRLEPLAESGVGAKDLEGGLRKIAAGELAPEVLAIRLVRMPGDQGDTAGEIVRVDSALWSRRDYRSMKDGEAEITSPLPEGFAADFAQTAVERELWSIPVNVPGTRHEEVEVRVLNHRKTVISRDFTRIEPGTMTAEKGRFDAVVSAIEGLQQ